MINEYNYANEDEDINQIEDNIWLGNTFAAANITDLKEKGITKILSLMDGNSSNFSYKEQGFNQKIINIMDYDTENIIQYFGECINFIKGEEKVFVHCAAGESRSATIVIAYLMWKKKMSFDKAYNLVKEKRSRIYPNFGFRQQLQMFEKLLYENGFNLSNIYFRSIKWKPSENRNNYFSFY